MRRDKFQICGDATITRSCADIPAGIRAETMSVSGISGSGSEISFSSTSSVSCTVLETWTRILPNDQDPDVVPTLGKVLGTTFGWRLVSGSGTCSDLQDLRAFQVLQVPVLEGRILASFPLSSRERLRSHVHGSAAAD